MIDERIEHLHYELISTFEKWVAHAASCPQCYLNNLLCPIGDGLFTAQAKADTMWNDFITNPEL